MCLEIHCKFALCILLSYFTVKEEACQDMDAVDLWHKVGVLFPSAKRWLIIFLHDKPELKFHRTILVRKWHPPT